MDDRTSTNPSPALADPKTSLRYILAESPNDTITEQRRSERTADTDVRTPGATVCEPLTKSATSTSRKRKDPPLGSVQNNHIHSANKLKALKKDDGDPLWRKDIQYDFLKAVFEDRKAVFTNSYQSDQIIKQTFADLYIDTMARSSMTSKILRDKLLGEHESAKNMAMVCLLVNIGRMNTTLNFFPEMRAQLRTYHAIPSLQAQQDTNSYKQLQDSPRLKSIIKGALEDRPEPKSLDEIKIEDVPRTNPVNLVSVLAQSAPKVTELHFPANGDFYDLIMKEDVSSTSRALSFLWLMWFYLESDFTEEGVDENPFGPGVDYDLDAKNQGVPEFEYLTKEQQDLENVDTPEEILFGNTKLRERKRIIHADQAATQAERRPPKRDRTSEIHVTPVDGGPDAPPPRSPGDIQIQSKFKSNPRFRVSPRHEIVNGSSSFTYQGETDMRRPRPLTAHQLAVDKNRSQRVDYILRRGLRQKHHLAKKQRLQGSAIWRALQRIKQMGDPFDDSEGEDDSSRENLPFKARGFGGLVQLEVEQDDFGEEMSAYAAALRRTSRRLDRWDNQKDFNLGVVSTNRVLQTKPADINHRGTAKDSNGTEDERHFEQSQPKAVWDVYIMDEEDLNNMDQEMLELGSEAEEDGAEDLDDVNDEALNAKLRLQHARDGKSSARGEQASSHSGQVAARSLERISSFCRQV